MIERRGPRPATWVDQHELPPGGSRDPVLSPSVRQPDRPAGDSTHQPAGSGAEGALGAGVVIGGERAPCLRQRGGGQDVAKQNGDECDTLRAHLERLPRRAAKGNYFPGSPRHGRVRVLSAVAPIDELDQTGAGEGVIRVLAPLAVEGIECPPAADPHLRDAIRILLTDPVGVEPRATLANPSALHPGEGKVE